MAKKTRKKTNTKSIADKAGKFIELASKRMTKALKAIAQLQNLSNRANYEHTDAQINVMLKALRTEVQSLEDAFKTKDKAAPGGFEFE